jgi:predicted nucleic acid-binding protein
MPFVLDASITASWFFPDENFSESAQAWERSATDDVLVPQHWWFEVRNAMLTGERRGRISTQLVSNALENLSRIPIIAVSRPEESAVFALARQHRLTFYDAVYLELARREGIALATLDLELAAAARAEGIALIE